MACLEDPQIQLWLEQMGINPDEQMERAVVAADVLTLFAYSPDWLIEEITTSDWFDNGDASKLHNAVFNHVLANLLASQTPLSSLEDISEFGPLVDDEHEEVDRPPKPGDVRIDQIDPEWEDIETVLRKQGVRFGRPLSGWFVEFFLQNEGVLSKDRFKSWSSGYLDTELDDGLSAWDRSSVFSPENRATDRFMSLAQIESRRTTGYAAQLHIWVLQDLAAYGKGLEAGKGRWARLMDDLGSACLVQDEKGRVQYSGTNRTVSRASLSNMVSKIKKADEAAEARKRKLTHGINSNSSDLT